MKLQFVKLSPTQNVTVLVRDSVFRELQPEIAQRLLAYDGVGGEQVGFIEHPTLPGARARLQMMGGEFCGNASMSLGALLAREDDLPDGSRAEYDLEVSGAKNLVRCGVERSGEVYYGTVQMPLPEGFSVYELPTDFGALRLPSVHLPGIAHVILPESEQVDRAEIERRIRGWNQIVHAEALGVLLHNEETHLMSPIVYVPGTDSAIWERGCGSGTAALGCWKAMKRGQSVTESVVQPGGRITVSATFEDEKITGLTITGAVRITAEGTAYL